MITECWTPQSSHRDTFFSIYLVLNVSQAHIEKIARENPHSEDDAKMALFSEWLRTSLKASWRDVIDALKKMNERALADEIEQKLRIEPEQQRAPIDLNPQSNFFYYVIFIITIYYSTGLDAYEVTSFNILLS